MCEFYFYPYCTWGRKPSSNVTLCNMSVWVQYEPNSQLSYQSMRKQRSKEGKQLPCDRSQYWRDVLECCGQTLVLSINTRLQCQTTAWSSVNFWSNWGISPNKWHLNWQVFIQYFFCCMSLFSKPTNIVDLILKLRTKWVIETRTVVGESLYFCIPDFSFIHDVLAQMEKVRPHK